MLPQSRNVDQSIVYVLGSPTCHTGLRAEVPRWAASLGIETLFEEVPLSTDASASELRQFVETMKVDPRVHGALVRAQKRELLRAAQGLFDGLGAETRLLGEINLISKRDGQLWGHATDPALARRIFAELLPEDWWPRSGGEVLIFGGGGTAAALAGELMSPQRGRNRPAMIHLADPTQARLDDMEKLHELQAYDVPCRYHHAPAETRCDALLAALPPRSLVINTAGLDDQRSDWPLSAAAVFPEAAIAWELGLAVDSSFRRLAHEQEVERNLTVVDGTRYALHEWALALEEIFHIEVSSAAFEELAAAGAARAV